MYQFILGNSAGLFAGYWITDQGLGVLGPLFSLVILLITFATLVKTNKN
jgi:hypothetical protein